MAKQTIVQLTDDLDGSEADETVSFGFRGSTYEIDLNAKNAAAMERALSKYLDAARRVSGGRGRPRSAGRRGSRRNGEGLSAIREWARSNGYQISERGRISSEVREAYEAANS